jgi:hypothetical protein
VTEFEEFILALAAAINDGARAEQALRIYVIDKAKEIRQREADNTEQKQ